MTHTQVGHFGNRYYVHHASVADTLPPITFRTDTSGGMYWQDYLTADEAEALAEALLEQARLARVALVEQTA